MNGSKEAEEVGNEYSSSLADLTVNSKPLINVLTILAEENIVHAGSIVQSVEKHLEKVRPDVKLPVLYLVDSIIKNVGGAYTQLFSQIIVNMFCRVFKQVDEKTRSQMFKLRETWHEVFPSIKLYQLDVKVSLIDPAWPIQAHPPQSNIHVNPNFFKKPADGAAAVPVAPPPGGPALTPLEEDMRNAVALKEQELLQLQQKKIEMELEQTRRQLQEQRKALDRTTTAAHSMNVLVAPVILPSSVTVPGKSRHTVTSSNAMPSVSTGTGRIAPANPALVNHARRRDPRLSRQGDTQIMQHTTTPIPASFDPYEVSNSVIAPNLFDIKPLERPARGGRHKSSHDIAESQKPRDESKHQPYHNRKDPRIDRTQNLENRTKLSKAAISKRSRSPGRRPVTSVIKKDKSSSDEFKLISERPKLPTIAKIKSKNAEGPRLDSGAPQSSPVKRKKDQSCSPRSNGKPKKLKDSSLKSEIVSPKSIKTSSEQKKIKIKPKFEPMETETLERPAPSDVTFKELKTCTKERNYIRRNREKSESPECTDVDLRSDVPVPPVREKTSDAPDRLPASKIKHQYKFRNFG